MINYILEHWLGLLVTILYFGFIGWFTWAIHKHEKCKK
jgi:hypothetical protein